MGWLDSAHAFPTGTTPDGFLEVLKQWKVRASANQMRGWHDCPFCQEAPWEEQHPFTTLHGDRLLIGSDEIWIPGENGVIYAAPSLVIHYVEAHSYLPPQVFLDAVMRSIPGDWNAAETARRLATEARKKQPDVRPTQKHLSFDAARLLAAALLFEQKRGRTLSREEEAEIQAAGLYRRATDYVAEEIWHLVTHDPDPSLRGTAYWSLGKLMREGDRARLIEALGREVTKDGDAMYQVMIALDNLGEEVFSRSSVSVKDVEQNREDALAYLRGQEDGDC